MTHINVVWLNDEGGYPEIFQDIYDVTNIMKGGEMRNSENIKSVTVEYHDGQLLMIEDGYQLNEITGLLSSITFDQQQELMKFLNEMEVE